MRLSRCLASILILTAVSATGCAAPVDEPEGSAATAVTTSLSGEWMLSLWKGHVETHVGSQYEQTSVDRHFALDPSTRVRFDIDSEGSGRMVGLKSCRLEFEETAPEQEARATKAGAAFGVVMGLFKLFSGFECTPGELKTETTHLSPRKNFFGWPDAHLNANLGVLGETEDGASAENDCRALVSVKWVNIGFDGTVACIGQMNASTMRMIVQRPSQIHVQRLTLKRVE